MKNSSYKLMIAGRVFAAALAIPCAVVSSVSTPFVIISYAAEDNEASDGQLKKSVDEAVSFLEKSFGNQYDSVTEQIKHEIKEKGYDYELTMQSYHDNENPFKTMDYTKLVAAYATAKEYTYENGMPKRHMLTDAQFLAYTITEKTYDDGKKYGVVKLSVESPEYIFSYFGIPMDSMLGGRTVKAIYTDKQEKIDAAVFGVELNQNVFVATRRNVGTSSNYKPQVESLIASLDISSDRRRLIKTAMSLLGQVPYEWGGKPSKAGYDNSWWLYGDNGQQNGLDCSGFVQWAFMTAGFGKSITDELLSTRSTVSSFTHISRVDLQPGDLGLFNDGSLSSNHVGIYLGDGYWIHCSSTADTVIIAKNVGFNVFVRVLDANGTSSDASQNGAEYGSNESGQELSAAAQSSSEESSNANTGDSSISDSGASSAQETSQEADPADVKLLAQLIQHEAGGEGLNGWVAVGEVVMNRVKNPKFKENSIKDVVYADGQFSKSKDIASIEPRQEIMDVAEDVINGKISIFNNPNVLYFRNPVITSGISAKVKADWGKLKYYGYVGAHSFYIDDAD